MHAFLRQMGQEDKGSLRRTHANNKIIVESQDCVVQESNEILTFKKPQTRRVDEKSTSFLC